MTWIPKSLKSFTSGPGMRSLTDEQLSDHPGFICHLEPGSSFLDGRQLKTLSERTASSRSGSGRFARPGGQLESGSQQFR
jgi:hypothetical protein